MRSPKIYQETCEKIFWIGQCNALQGLGIPPPIPLFASNPFCVVHGGGQMTVIAGGINCGKKAPITRLD